MVRNLCLCVLLAVLGCNLSEASSCNCTDAICPTMGTFCPNGRILGDCGCCSVCVRRANEVCGGKHSILGKCESDLRCAYERFKLESKLKIGFCEYPTGSANATSISCPKKRYIDKRVGKDHVNRCYEEACGKIKLIHKVPLSCLEIGCGIEKSLDSVCCLMCKRDKPRVLCNSGQMKILIPKSTMSKDLFSRSTLIDISCQGFEGKQHYIFTTNIHKCGTMLLKQNKGVQSFSNSVQTTYRESDASIVKKLFYKFLCTFESKTSVQTFYKVKQKITSSDITGIKLIFASIGGRILHKKERFIESEKRMDVAISNSIAKKYNLRIVIDWCRLSASKSIALTNGKEHYLIRKGCIVDKKVKIRFRKGHAIWFSYETIGAPATMRGKMYLHCDIIMCLKRSKSTKCANSCI